MQIPHNRLIRRKKGHSSAKCDKCGNVVRVRHLIKFKNKYLCSCCQQTEKSYKINQLGRR